MNDEVRAVVFSSSFIVPASSFSFRPPVSRKGAPMRAPSPRNSSFCVQMSWGTTVASGKPINLNLYQPYG
jgi:hypothetical protein